MWFTKDQQCHPGFSCHIYQVDLNLYKDYMYVRTHQSTYLHASLCVNEYKYQGFPTRMVYLYYVSLQGYTILFGNPRYESVYMCICLLSSVCVFVSVCACMIYLDKLEWVTNPQPNVYAIQPF